MMFPGLIIRSSSIHAAGCYTTRPIQQGIRICEYNGPRMSKAEADARYEGRFVTYLFSCGGDLVIDGFGTAMYNLHDSDDDDQDCYCGTSNCRKTMFSEYELKRRARTAKRKAAKEFAASAS
jgi:hypothetical protein